MQLVSMLDRAVAGKQPVSFRTAMSGVHFKVAAMHVSWSLSLSLSFVQTLFFSTYLQAPPLMTISKNAGGNTTYHGYIKDICDWIFDAKHNTTYAIERLSRKSLVLASFSFYGCQVRIHRRQYAADGPTRFDRLWISNGCQRRESVAPNHLLLEIKSSPNWVLWSQNQDGHPRALCTHAFLETVSIKSRRYFKCCNLARAGGRHGRPADVARSGEGQDRRLYRTGARVAVPLCLSVPEIREQTVRHDPTVPERGPLSFLFIAQCCTALNSVSDRPRLQGGRVGN